MMVAQASEVAVEVERGVGFWLYFEGGTNRIC